MTLAPGFGIEKWERRARKSICEGENEGSKCPVARQRERKRPRHLEPKASEKEKGCDLAGQKKNIRKHEILRRRTYSNQEKVFR